MSTILEMLFDATNRSLRRRGPLGVLVGLLLIVYVEIPAVTAAARAEIRAEIRSLTRNLHQSELKLVTREHHAVHHRQRPRRRHHARPRP